MKIRNQYIALRSRDLFITSSLLTLFVTLAKIVYTFILVTEVRKRPV